MDTLLIKDTLGEELQLLKEMRGNAFLSTYKVNFTSLDEEAEQLDPRTILSDSWSFFLRKRKEESQIIKDRSRKRTMGTICMQ